MANEPSLGDITGMPIDPERGSGIGPVIYDNRELGKTLHDNAEIKARNDWNKYNIFLGRLDNVYKDINEIAKQPVLEEDMPALRTDMASIIKDIGSDPKSFFGGGPKYNEINGKIAQLQSKATESKGNNLFDAAHRQFFYRNPDLETPENQKRIEDFRKQPLGSRQPYQLDMPGLLDMDALAKTINANVKKEESYSRATPDNQFIEKGKNIVFDPVKFDELAAAAYDQNDPRNIPIRKTMEKRFSDLPVYMQDQIKDQYKGQQDPVKAWFIDDLRKRRMADSNTKEDLVPNPGYLEQEKLAQKRANDKAELGLKWANYGLSKDKADKADSEDLSGADSVLNEALAIIKKGDDEAGTDWLGRPNKSFDIADPATLQYFGKLDKDGKAYDVPEYAKYNKTNNQLELVYEHKDSKGKITSKESKPLDERTWVSLIVKRKFPNKDIGGINQIVDEVIKKNGNLYNLSKTFNTGQGNPAPSSTEPKHTAKMADGTIITSSDGKTWFDKNGKKID